MYPVSHSIFFFLNSKPYTVC